MKDKNPKYYSDNKSSNIEPLVWREKMHSGEHVSDIYHVLYASVIDRTCAHWLVIGH